MSECGPKLVLSEAIFMNHSRWHVALGSPPHDPPVHHFPHHHQLLGPHLPFAKCATSQISLHDCDTTIQYGAFISSINYNATLKFPQCLLICAPPMLWWQMVIHFRICKFAKLKRSLLALAKSSLPTGMNDSNLISTPSRMSFMSLDYPPTSSLCWPPTLAIGSLANSLGVTKLHLSLTQELTSTPWLDSI